MLNRVKMIAGAAGVALLAAACQPGVYYDNTQNLALAGAAVGCVGVLTFDPSSTLSNAEDCARGALVGGLVGGAFGLYLDEQEAMLNNELAGTGIRVVRSSQDELRVVLPAEISFASGSASLTSGARSALDKIANTLASYPNSVVFIDGHTDNVGTAESNMRLSIHRAENVADYLSGRGVNGSRLVARGFGETEPQASNATASGRAENRRVELRIRSHR